MTPRQLETLMKKQELRQIDVARLLRTTPRQVRRWQKDGMPVAETIVLRLLDAGYVSLHDIEMAGRVAGRSR